MCSHYEGIDPRTLVERFKAKPPAEPTRADFWPGYVGSFIRRPREADSGDEAVPDREALAGIFGLVPPWAEDLTLARHTYNARSETVAEKPSFRDAWRHARHCIIPASAFYEPDWRSGKAVPTRIARADGEPLGIAGLWDSWLGPDGKWLHSYTMLTINADTHELMQLFHKPTDEKRMVAILPEGSYDDWLSARPDQSRAFLNPYPADRLISSPAVHR